MKRKVAKIGSSTLMISLPNKWARQHSIKKGDEIEIEEQGKRLVISLDKELELDKKEIEIKEVGSIIGRILVALYKSGYDEIKIKYKDPRIIEFAQEKIRNAL